MNYLAHLFLVGDNSADALIGSILPDLVRLRPGDALPPAMQAAVALHRRIDAFTDTHPAVARSKDRLRPGHGRFTGVLTDIFYDHLLANEWNRYTPDPLERFIARVHTSLSRHAHRMPPAMQSIAHRLVQQNWLACYGSAEGMDLVLTRLSQRLSQRFERPIDLVPALADLMAHRPALTEDFHVFFPEVMAMAGIGQ